MKKRLIIITAVVLLLLSGCQKQRLEEVSAQSGALTDVSTEQTVPADTVTEGGKQETTSAPQGGKTEVKMTGSKETYAAGSAEQNAIVPAEESTRSATPSAAEPTTARAATPSTTKPSADTAATSAAQKPTGSSAGGNGAPAPAAQNTLPSADSRKDQYELPVNLLG